MDLKTWALWTRIIILLDCQDLLKRTEMKRVHSHRTFRDTRASYVVCTLSYRTLLACHLSFGRFSLYAEDPSPKRSVHPFPASGVVLVLWDPRKHRKDGINKDQRQKKTFPGSYVHKRKHSKTSLHTPWEWKKQKQRERMIYTIHRNSICWEESPATGHSLVKVSNLHRWNTHAPQLPELPTDERALVDC